VTELGLRHSMGSIGSCLDNAVAESFLTTLKASSSTASITAAVEGA
jgi:transposase InsO family protein